VPEPPAESKLSHRDAVKFTMKDIMGEVKDHVFNTKFEKVVKRKHT